MSNEITVFDFVEAQKTNYLSVLTDEKMQWEKERQFAIQILDGNDYLAKMAIQQPDSFNYAISNAASIGVTLNPASRHAYLVPRKGKVCLDIGYIGLLHLAMSTGSLNFGQAKIVYSNDEYVNNGVDNSPTHKYSAFGDRGDAVGVYCTVKTSTGEYLTEEMDKAQVHDIRSRSEAFKSGKKCPWTTDELEMWRKTVVKRGAKYWPHVERLDNAINYLNENNDEGINEIKDISPISELSASTLIGLAKEKGRSEIQLCAWASSKFKREISKISDLYLSELELTENMVKNA